MTLLRIALLIVPLCLAGAASALDVCLLDSANQAGFALKKVKLPKRPAEAVPVSGLGLTSTSATPLPLSGTLVRDPEGDLFLGLTRYFQSCLISFVLDESLNGTVAYDCNLDGATDTTASVAPVDCTLLLPQ